MNETRWDGHCHTEFCPHGKGDPTSEMIERAIDLGFTKLSLTEHAPLPAGLIADRSLFDELALTQEQLPRYLDHCRALKKAYAGRIELLVGLEVDYVPGFEEYVLDFYDQWGDQLEDSVLSVHFLENPVEPLMIDYSPQHFEQTVLAAYPNLSEVHQAYWETILRSVSLPFGSHKPQRLGHLGLISKFSKIFPAPQFNLEVYGPLVEAIVSQGYSLDYNVAGFSRSTCGHAYMPDPLLSLAQKAGIPLVYGSDAHSIQGIGLFYESYQEINHV